MFGKGRRLAPAVPWLWMLLLTLPLLGLYFESEKRTLQRMIVAFLDEVAARHEFTKLHSHPAKEPASPPSARQ